MDDFFEYLNMCICTHIKCMLKLVGKTLKIGVWGIPDIEQENEYDVSSEIKQSMD